MATRKPIEAAELPAHQRAAVILPATGSVDVPADDGVAVAEGPLEADYAQALKDAEDVLTIEIHETEDKLADPLPMVAVNGRNQFIPRGVQVEVRRKFVEVLARAKPEAIETKEFLDGDGARAIRVDRRSALKYPFTLIHDPNPRYGQAWLRKLIAEPA